MNMSAAIGAAASGPLLGIIGFGGLNALSAGWCWWRRRSSPARTDRSPETDRWVEATGPPAVTGERARASGDRSTTGPARDESRVGPLSEQRPPSVQRHSPGPGHAPLHRLDQVGPRARPPG